MEPLELISEVSGVPRGVILAMIRDGKAGASL